MPDTSIDLTKDTALAFGNLVLTAAAYRGLTGDIQPIDNGMVIEMLDFSLLDQTVPAGRLYEGTLSTSDMNAPPFFGTFKGHVLTDFDFPSYVAEDLVSFPDGPTRTPVPGSLFYVDADDNEVPEGDASAMSRMYRPRFAAVMIMDPWKLGFDEYELKSTFTCKWREMVV